MLGADMDNEKWSMNERAGEAASLELRGGAASLRDKGRFFVRGGLAFALQSAHLFVFNETHERTY
jgi:hypothetical protein